MVQKWTGLVVGFWIMLSPWLLGFSSVDIMKWSNVLCGLIVILMNAWELFGKEHVPQRKDEK